MIRLSLFYVFVCVSILSSCSDCSQFENESYLENENLLEVEAKESLNLIYNYLGDKDYATYPYESYRLLTGEADALEKQLIRIDHSDEGYTLTYKIFTAKATPDNQDIMVEIVDENTYTLSDIDWEKFINMIYKKSYWTMPEMINKTGYKGVTFFLEGRRPQAEACNKRTQHIVTSWNPNSGDFYALCNQMKRLLNTYKTK